MLGAQPLVMYIVTTILKKCNNLVLLNYLIVNELFWMIFVLVNVIIIMRLLLYVNIQNSNHKFLFHYVRDLKG